MESFVSRNGHRNRFPLSIPNSDIAAENWAAVKTPLIYPSPCRSSNLSQVVLTPHGEAMENCWCSLRLLDSTPVSLLDFASSLPLISRDRIP